MNRNVSVKDLLTQMQHDLIKLKNTMLDVEFGMISLTFLDVENSEKDVIIASAKSLCEKFINKVDSGRAHSVETYNECGQLLEKINTMCKR